MKKITLKWKVAKKPEKTMQKAASHFTFKSCTVKCGQWLKPCVRGIGKTAELLGIAVYSFTAFRYKLYTQRDNIRRGKV